MCVRAGENMLTKKLVSSSKDTVAGVYNRGMQREMLLNSIKICNRIYYSWKN